MSMARLPLQPEAKPLALWKARVAGAGYRNSVQRSNEGISVTIFSGCHGRLGFYDGIDATN